MLIIPVFSCISWGFFVHRRINQLAVFTLPPDMLRFFKYNSKYIREHAVDPDKRRYIDSLEGARHYIDMEDYENDPDSIPEKWEKALQKYGGPKLYECGIVPWQIEKSYRQLTTAFMALDSLKILKYATELGHYVGDAHVPLHTTRNHNGQLSNQHGIHAFWESRIPELFSQQYELLTGKARYIDDPLKSAWAIVRQSHAAVDSVLLFEAALHKKFPSDRKYNFSKRGNVLGRYYSEAYAAAYDKLLNGMAEKRMRAAILAIGSYWYSAWVDAGQPKLEGFKKKDMDDDSVNLNSSDNGTENSRYGSKKKEKTIKKRLKKGAIIGREV